MVKFLEYQDLAQYNCLLDGLDSGDSYVYGKVEVYSCKRTTQDKKLSKEIAQRYQHENASALNNTSVDSSTSMTSPSMASDDESDIEDEGQGRRRLSAAASPKGIPVQQTKKNAFLSHRFQQLNQQQQQPTTTIAGSYEDQFNQHSPGSFGSSGNYFHNMPQNNIKNNSSNVRRSRSGSFSVYTNNDTNTPFGPLSNPANRNLFTDFISTLNDLYQDYEFRSARPEDFSREPSMEHVYNSINLSLQDTLSHQNRNNLWSSIDRIIDIRHCDIFTYHPDEDDTDPLSLGDGKVWSWNYFFYNKKQKKILFFACYAKSKMSSGNNGLSGSNIDLETMIHPTSSLSSLYDDDMSPDDSDSEYYSTPKNQYVHAYPRMSGSYINDRETADAFGYDMDAMADDDDDGMAFDDMM